MKQLRLRKWLVMAYGLMAGALVYAETAKTSFTPQQQAEIQTIMHDYLVKNPQVLVEVAKALQQQEQSKQQSQAQQAITRYSVRLFESPNSPVAGNPRGDVNMVEFFDYQCGYCKRVNPLVKKLMQEDKNLRVVYKELPIFGPESEFAAKAALAARKQDKYDKFHQALMQNSNKLTQEAILAIAKQVGLDVKKLQADMVDKSIAEQLQENTMLANALGVAGTPSFVIATNPVLDPKAKVKSFFISGAANEETLKNFIKEARS